MKNIILTILTTISFLGTCSVQSEIYTDEDMALLIQYSKNSLRDPLVHYSLKENRPDIALIGLELYPEQATQTAADVMLIYDDPWSDWKAPFYFRGLEKGASALELAINIQDVEVIKSLLNLKADTNSFRTVYDGNATRMDWKKVQNSPTTNIGVLVKQANLSLFTKYSMLYTALMTENNDIIQLLLENGSSLENIYTRSEVQNWEVNVSQMNSFQFATHNNDLQLLRKLIYFQITRNNPAMDISEEDIDPSIVELVYSYSQNDFKWPVLHYALYLDDLEAFTTFIDIYMDPNDIENNSGNLFSIAMDHSNPEYLALLTKRDKNSVLLTAVKNNRLDLVSKMLDTDTKDSQLLEIAVKNNQAELVNLLAQHGIQSDAALTIAIEKSNFEIVSTLLSCGFKAPNALALAIKSHHPDIFTLLFIDSSSDVELFKLAVEEKQQGMLTQMIERDGISDKDLLELKKYALQKKNSEALTYLYSL